MRIGADGSKLVPFEPRFGVIARGVGVGWEEMRLGFALKADSSHKKDTAKADRQGSLRSLLSTQEAERQDRGWAVKSSLSTEFSPDPLTV